VAEKARGRIIEFLVSRGDQLISNQLSLGLPPPPSIAVSDGRCVTVVMPLTKEEIVSGNALLKTIVNAVAHRGRANKLYIASPKIYAASIDGSVLQDNGVGLIVYDDKRVFESIPARETIIETQETDVEDLAELKSGLSELRGKVRSLEAGLLSASREIRELKEAVNSLRNQVSKRRLVTAEKSQVRFALEVPQGTEQGDLPSFIMGNPWVEVLAGRGEEE